MDGSAVGAAVGVEETGMMVGGSVGDGVQPEQETEQEVAGLDWRKVRACLNLIQLGRWQSPVRSWNDGSFSAIFSAQEVGAVIGKTVGLSDGGTVARSRDKAAPAAPLQQFGASIPM